MSVLPSEMVAILLSIAIASTAPSVYPLTSTAGIEQVGSATLTPAAYRGKRAVLMNEELDPNFGDLGIIKGADFHNGTIDFDVAGLLTKNAPLGARSFVGIAFHVSDDNRKFENFYLRMTNGRAADQEQRNHAVQYSSIPTYTWDVLRKKRPSKYEAYTDLDLGAWTHVKVHVYGTEAQLFVGNVTQPTLIVHDLFLGDTHGKVALWVAGYTRAYFSNLKIQAS